METLVEGVDEDAVEEVEEVELPKEAIVIPIDPTTIQVEIDLEESMVVVTLKVIMEARLRGTLSQNCRPGFRDTGCNC